MIPIGTLILVERDKDITERKSGIQLSTPQASYTGKVIKISDGTNDYTIKSKVGDRVRYRDNCGVPINYLGKNCILLKEDYEVIAILDEQTNG